MKEIGLYYQNPPVVRLLWYSPIITQSPQGTGTTIKGSYETKEEFEQNPPPGSPDDAYLVEGEIYIWNETEDWHSGGNLKGEQGEQGTGTTIKGSYETKEEFEQGPPPGSPDDAYLVEDEIYIWNETSGWHSAGSLRGPTEIQLFSQAAPVGSRFVLTSLPGLSLEIPPQS